VLGTVLNFYFSSIERNFSPFYLQGYRKKGGGGTYVLRERDSDLRLVHLASL
jgi:hypothetical protein